MIETVLAIDTSTEVASVAVVRGQDVLAEQEAPDVARHDHVLLPRIQAVLASAGLGLGDLTLLAVGAGPGAFGGLRVGLATIKGLALATQLPCVGVCSLHALGAGVAAHHTLVCTLIDAHRGELFAALYTRDGHRLIEQIAPFHGTPDRVASTLRTHGPITPYVVGHKLSAHLASLCAAWPELSEARISDNTIPRARHVAALAIDRQRAGETSSADTLLPIYIRDSDAKLPAQPLLLAPETKD